MNLHSLIEPLEARIAPATLFSPTTVTYQDVDGDNVTVKISKPLFNSANIDQVFTWDTGSVNGTKANPQNATKQQLYKLDLASIGTAFNGGSISITTTGKTPNGADGFANMGYIKADGIDLGAVTIEGDLGKLVAGAGTSGTPGLKSLTVQSMGIDGGSGAPDRFTSITGTLGSLKVKRDVAGASVEATGSLGAVTIGGNLTGTAAAGTGKISSKFSSVGNITIGGGITGNGDFSGLIQSSGPMGKVKIAGALTGGAGKNSGCIFSSSTIAGVSIGRALVGANGADSGSIEAGGNIGPVTIGSAALKLGVKSGSGPNSGRIATNGKLASLTIFGNVMGTADETDGQLYGKTGIGPIKIVGSLIGPTGVNAASINSNSSVARITSVEIGGSMNGGTGGSSGSIYCGGSIGKVKVAGFLIGKDGAFGASIMTGLGDIGTVTIAQSMFAGAGGATAGIWAGGRLGSVTVGGSIYSSEMGTVLHNNHDGWICAGKDIGAVIVKGSIVGNADNSVVITAGFSPTPTATRDVAIKSITVGQDATYLEIRAGYDPNGGQVGAFVDSNAQIGSVTIGGNWDHGRISAGAGPGQDGHPGSDDDVLAGTISRIASVVIKGFATGGGPDYFIDSGKVGSLTVHAVKALLTAGPDNLNVGGTLPVRDLR